ncbi:MAG TPA: hypothetical protein EYH26_02030 [Pyrodictium sp.]|nr:hypothetical protein [Pyrodictium sp.]HIQ56050.1 hypothetical protein [Pyrodictium sp.]
MHKEIVIYLPSTQPEKYKSIVEMFKRIGFSVHVERVGDIDDIAVWGPFGVIRGSGEVRVVLNQLMVSRNGGHGKVHRCRLMGTRS